jgi:hypothetical protein
LQKAIGEPTSGGSNIEATEACDINLESRECVIKLDAPARDEPPCVCDLDKDVNRERLPWFGSPVPALTNEDLSSKHCCSSFTASLKQTSLSQENVKSNPIL